MALTCDCYGGCWGDHSKDWPKTTVQVSAKAQIARLTMAHGTYVVMPGELRVIDAKMLKDLEKKFGSIQRDIIAGDKTIPQSAYLTISKRGEGDWDIGNGERRVAIVRRSDKDHAVHWFPNAQAASIAHGERFKKDGEALAWIVEHFTA